MENLLKLLKKVISSKIFKDFVEDILNGKIKNSKKEKYTKIFNDVEKKESERVNKLKNYLTKIKDSVYGKDRDKIKTDEAKSFKDQKGIGHVNLPIALSKIYTNNSSKELTNDIKNLLNNLYDKNQITRQVYNNLIKAITYKNDS